VGALFSMVVKHRGRILGRRAADGGGAQLGEACCLGAGSNIGRLDLLVAVVAAEPSK
jgi:hypothetical protein